MELYPTSKAQAKFGYTVLTLAAWIIAGYMANQGAWVPIVFVGLWTVAFTWDFLITPFVEQPDVPTVGENGEALTDAERKSLMVKAANERQRIRTHQQLVKDIEVLKAKTADVPLPVTEKRRFWKRDDERGP